MQSEKAPTPGKTTLSTFLRSFMLSIITICILLKKDIKTISTQLKNILQHIYIYIYIYISI